MITNLFYFRQWPIGVILATLLVGLAGCTASQPTTVPLPNQDISQPLPEQFDMVDKDGVEIACPKYWHSESDSNLVYCVSRSDYIRITVAVLSALPISYYEGLVKQGAVAETSVRGNPTYMNDYAYSYQDHQLISRCITVVQGSEACHIMILCEASLLGAFEPTFAYVLDSLNFQAVDQ